MNSRTTWIPVACVVATLSMTVVAQDQDASPSADQAQPKSSAAAAAPKASFPAGVKTKEVNDADAIRSTLNSITEAALTDDGFDDVIERLVDQDRNRVGDYAEKEFSDLNGVAEQIRRAWKEKFNKNVEVEEKSAFEPVALMQGEIDDPKQVAAKWPVAATPPQPGDAVTAGAAEKVNEEATRTKGNDDPDLNSNIEKGRDVAIATFPTSHGAPALNVSMIREAGGWRVDVPNRLSGQQLHDNLLKHLTHVSMHSNQWPSDENAAAAMIAHHVLMAVNGVEMPKSR